MPNPHVPVGHVTTQLSTKRRPTIVTAIEVGTDEGYKDGDKKEYQHQQACHDPVI